MAMAVWHTIRFTGVVLVVRMSEEDCGALEENVVQRLVENFGPFNLTHIELEPCADPWKRRIGVFPSIRSSLSGGEFLEVFLKRQSGKNSASDRSFQTVDVRQERAGGRG